MLQTWSNNWMSAIDDDAMLSQISIPGTHDSCARYNKNTTNTQCQWFSIIQQLNRGIRFLDIRCRYIADSESGRTQNLYFPIHHGSVFQDIFFEEVQAQCIAFLRENPSECILMNVQIEYEGDSTPFREKFLQLTAPYQAEHWHFGDSNTTLKDCRGKIVLIRAYDGDTNTGWAKGESKNWPDGSTSGGLEWNGFNVDGLSSNPIFMTQNGWKAWSGTKKGEEVEKYLESAQAYCDTYITLNFASYSNDSGPGPNAEGMNTRLRNFLLEKRNSKKWNTCLGVVVLDFTGNTGDAGDNLENLIIEHQYRQVSDSSYSGLPAWLTIASK